MLLDLIYYLSVCVVVGHPDNRQVYLSVVYCGSRDCLQSWLSVGFELVSYSFQYDMGLWFAFAYLRLPRSNTGLSCTAILHKGVGYWLSSVFGFRGNKKFVESQK